MLFFRYINIEFFSVIIFWFLGFYFLGQNLSKSLPEWCTSKMGPEWVRKYAKTKYTLINIAILLSHLSSIFVLNALLFCIAILEHFGGEMGYPFSFVYYRQKTSFYTYLIYILHLQCMFPENIVGGIETPLFVFESAFDSWKVIA